MAVLLNKDLGPLISKRNNEWNVEVVWVAPAFPSWSSAKDSQIQRRFRLLRNPM